MGCIQLGAKYTASVVIVLILLCTTLVGYSQSSGGREGKTRLQYGLSFDARWEIVWKYGYLSNVRIGASAGIGPVIASGVMPYAQWSFVAFQGGMGSSLSVHDRTKVNVESLFSLGAVGGFQKSALKSYKRGVYTMGALNPSPLINPFGWYLNLSSTIIHRFTKFNQKNILGKRNFSQKVGSISLGGPAWDINYYNDGTPFHYMGLGDGKDRYWTGGGFVNIHVRNHYDNEFSRNRIVRNIVVGFDRFTGHYPESFEVANNLGLNTVPYGDKSQAFFNKGRLFFGVELPELPGFVSIISFNDNNTYDIQHVIHRFKKQPVHNSLHTQATGLNLYYRRNFWDIEKKILP